MKTIVISGGTSGIGKALAKTYLQQNNRVVICGRSIDKINDVIHEFREFKNFLAFLCDVSSANDMKNFLHNIQTQFGIDILIANAGVSAGVIGLQSNEDFDAIGKEIFKINVDGVFNTIHPTIEYFKNKGSGKIVIISSMSAFLPMKSALFYAASKSAIKSYAEGLRMYLKNYNISVSVVFPGFVESNITLQNKFKMPFMMTSKKASKIIVKKEQKNRGYIVFPLRLYMLVYLISILPFFIKEKILSRLPNK